MNSDVNARYNVCRLQVLVSEYIGFWIFYSLICSVMLMRLSDPGTALVLFFVFLFLGEWCRFFSYSWFIGWPMVTELWFSHFFGRWFTVMEWLFTWNTFGSVEKDGMHMLGFYFTYIVVLNFVWELNCTRIDHQVGGIKKENCGSY